MAASESPPLANSPGAPAPAAAPRAESPPPSKEVAADGPVTDVAKALQSAASATRSKPEFLRQALRIIANHFDAVFAAMNLEGSGGVQRDVVRRGTKADEQWQKIAQALLLDVKFRNASRARYMEAGGGLTFAALALPLADAVNGPLGALAVIIPCASSQQGAALLAQLTAWSSMTAMLASQMTTAAKPAAAPAAKAPAGGPDLRGVDKAAAHDNLHHFAFSIVNGLKAKLGCEQVAIGQVRGHNTQVLCVSGTSEVYARSPGIRQIQQAMAECLDAGAPVVYQVTPQHAQESSHLRLMVHKQWHEAVGRTAVASIPLRYQGHVVGVLSARGVEQQTFSDDDIKKLQDLTATLTPGLVLLDRAGRTIVRHVLDEVARVAHLSRHSRFRQAMIGLAALLLTWLVFGQMEYVVTAPCELVADQQRRVAAPFEGAIAAVLVKPGDEVAAGQVLCELDTSQLRLDQQRYQSEIEMASVQLARAVAERQTGIAGEFQAQIDMSQAQLSLIEQRLERAQITAPLDGVVIDGDLRPRLGEVVPLGEPLVTVAPKSALALEVHIPEHAATLLAQGQPGNLALSARPDESCALSIDSVEPKSAVHGGQNVFVARATMLQQPAWVRAGMTGVAHVETGRRPVWWSMLHRVFDKLRLWMWRL